MDRGDQVLDEDARRRLLAADVIVEEKLDGANLVLWLDGIAPVVATRSGEAGIDRGGHRGRARAWIMSHADALRAVAGDRFALFGEWLLTRHGVGYDWLPAPFIGIDVLDRRSGDFLEVAERDRVLRSVEILVPPRLFEGVLGSEHAAEALIGQSAYGPDRAEGVIIRATRPEPGVPRIAKLIARGWRPVDDAAWARTPVENRIAG